MLKVLITGSKTYSNKIKIKNFIFQLKERYNKNNFIVATCGEKQGTDKYIKSNVLDFGLSYGEFIPRHKKKTLYSLMPNWYYEKSYSGKNFFIRDNDAIKWADLIILFCNQKDFQSIKFFKNRAKKLNKQINVIIE